MFLLAWLATKLPTFAKLGEALFTNKYFWIALAIACLSIFSYYKGNEHSNLEWQKKWDNMTAFSASQKIADQKAIQSNQLDSILLESQLKQVQGDSNEQINKANAATNAALDALSLQHRASRSTEGISPTSDSTTTQPTTYSTGRELFAEDSEFLTRQAGQTDMLVIKFNQCVASYNKVRDDVNKEQQTKLNSGS